MVVENWNWQDGKVSDREETERNMMVFKMSPKTSERGKEESNI